MTTTTRPSTAAEHADMARQILAGISEGAGNATASAILAAATAAQAHATLALVEEQRTANKIAAYQAELIVNPYGVGTHEHDKWWVDFGTPITEAVQR